MSRYSVVVVARDHPRALLTTLLHLRQHAAPSEVLLIDNASERELNSIIALARLPVRQLRLMEHQSLGTALNAGLDAAASDVVLLLHGDVRLQADPGHAVAWLEQRPDVGIVGGHLLATSRPPCYVLHAGYEVGHGRIGPKGIRGLERAFSQDATEVAAVSDACMLLRRTGLRFDERYWFRLEDVDLCYQYRQAGYRVVSLSSLRAVDEGSGGAQQHTGELSWAARQLASQLLYHERWCSDLPLERHPRQTAMLGQAAHEHLRQIDAWFRGTHGLGRDPVKGDAEATAALLPMRED